MTIKLTRASLRSRACYYRERDGDMITRIEALVPKSGLPVTRASVALARKAGISDYDIHWCLCYALEGTPATERAWRENACWCAHQALNAERRAGREPHPASMRAVEVAEQFARGEATREELATARVAAAASYGSTVGAAAARAAARAAAAAAAIAAAAAAAAIAAAAAAAAAAATTLVVAVDDVVDDLASRLEHLP